MPPRKYSKIKIVARTKSGIFGERKSILYGWFIRRVDARYFRLHRHSSSATLDSLIVTSIRLASTQHNTTRLASHPSHKQTHSGLDLFSKIYYLFMLPFVVDYFCCCYYRHSSWVRCCAVACVCYFDWASLTDDNHKS